MLCDSIGHLNAQLCLLFFICVLVPCDSVRHLNLQLLHRVTSSVLAPCDSVRYLKLKLHSVLSNHIGKDVLPLLPCDAVLLRHTLTALTFRSRVFTLRRLTAPLFNSYSSINLTDAPFPPSIAVFSVSDFLVKDFLRILSISAFSAIM